MVLCVRGALAGGLAESPLSSEASAGPRAELPEAGRPVLACRPALPSNLLGSGGASIWGAIEPGLSGVVLVYICPRRLTFLFSPSGAVVRWLCVWQPRSGPPGPPSVWSALRVLPVLLCSEHFVHLPFILRFCPNCTLNGDIQD